MVPRGCNFSQSYFRITLPTTVREDPLEQCAAFSQRHRPRLGIVLKHCCQEFRADVPAVVEHVPVDEFLPQLIRLHLIKKEVSKSEVDEPSIVKGKT